MASALEEGVHIIGVSILSGSHLELVPQIVGAAARGRAGNVPIVVGGIIPEADARAARAAGVARVYTPKDFALNHIMSDLVRARSPAHARRACRSVTRPSSRHAQSRSVRQEPRSRARST